MIKNILLIQLILVPAISFGQLNIDDAQKSQQAVNDCEKQAKWAEATAQNLHYLMEANEIAMRSTEVNNKELAALLALQAYNFNANHGGYPRNSNIYNGLSLALKKFGRFPKNISDSNPIADNKRAPKMTLKDVKSELLRRRLSGRISESEQIQFSHSKKLIATANKGRTVLVWDLANMRQRPMAIVETDSIRNFVFTDDDSKILCSLSNSPNDSSAIHGWPLKMEILANDLCALLTQNMTLEEWQQYVGSDFPYESTCKGFPPKK